MLIHSVTMCRLATGAARSSRAICLCWGKPQASSAIQGLQCRARHDLACRANARDAAREGAHLKISGEAKDHQLHTAGVTGRSTAVQARERLMHLSLPVAPVAALAPVRLTTSRGSEHAACGKAALFTMAAQEADSLCAQPGSQLRPPPQ